MFLKFAILVSLATLIWGGTVSEHNDADYLKGIIKSGVQMYMDSYDEDIEVEYDSSVEQDADELGFYIENHVRPICLSILFIAFMPDFRGKGKEKDIYGVRTSFTLYGGHEELQRWLEDKTEGETLKVGCMEVHEIFESDGTQFRCRFE